MTNTERKTFCAALSCYGAQAQMRCEIRLLTLRRRLGGRMKK